MSLKIKCLPIIIWLFLTALALNGQEAVTIIRLGDTFFASEDYFKASNYYLKALEKEPRSVTAKYKLAETYRLITNYQAAENFYGDVLRRSESSYPLARYYYALTQKFNGKYAEALGNFELFLKNIEANYYRRLQGGMLITFSEQARIELEGCLLAIGELSKTQIVHHFQLLAGPVNSEYNDYAAYTYHHDSSIVITSARAEARGSHFDHRFGESLTDLFRFEFKGGQWKSSGSEDRFEKVINSNYHDGSGVFNQDFTRFYFTHCAPNIDCEIFVTTLKNGVWQDPSSLNTNINKKGSDSMHPALTATGDTLFFATDRPGGLGDFDIWMSIAKTANSWGPAVNLGDYINTAFKEISPFYDMIGHTLFFSSDGHVGHGSLDILMAENIFDNSAELYNMGLPYNSSGDDAFFVLGEHGGLLSSNRGGGIGNFDIYAFQMEADAEMITEIINSKQEAGRNSIFVTDYNFDNPDIKMIEGIISHLLASRVHNAKMPFSEKDQKFYNDLSEADKLRIERIITSRMKFTNLANIKAVRYEDEFFYQQIAGDFRHYVDRMVTFYLEDYDLKTIVKIPDEEKLFFENLNSTSQESINRFIALKLNEYEDLELNDEYYSSLPSSQQNQVDDITENYFRSKGNLASLDLSDESLSFLTALDEDDRIRTELSIGNQVASISYNPNYQIKDEDKEFFTSLSKSQQNSIDNLAQAFIQASVNTIEDHFDPEDLDYYNSLLADQQKTFDKLLAKRIQNFIKADNYALEAFKQQELDQIIDFQMVDIVDINYLSDSVFTNNSSLALLAKEDQKRFSRLLASATTLIMMKNQSGIKTAALRADRKDELIDLIYKANPDFRNEMNGIVGADTSSGDIAKIDAILINRLFDYGNQLNTDSIDNGKLIENHFTIEGLKAQLGEDDFLLSMDDGQLAGISNLFISTFNNIQSRHSAEFKVIARNKEFDLSTLTALKRSPEIITYPTQIGETNEGEETKTLQTSENTELYPIEPGKLSPKEISQVEQVISSSKRLFRGNLTPKELQTYSQLPPLEKRFIDQVVKSNLEQYVLEKSPVLKINKADSLEKSQIINSLDQDLQIDNFRLIPSLSRPIASIDGKSPEDQVLFSNLILSVAKLIISKNTNKLNELVNSHGKGDITEVTGLNSNSNNAENDNNIVPKKPSTIKTSTSKLSPIEINQVERMISSSKRSFGGNLTPKELENYLKLPLLEKKLIDQVVKGNFENYILENSSILRIHEADSIELTQSIKSLSNDLQISNFRNDPNLKRNIASIEQKSQTYKTSFSNLLMSIAKLMIHKNADELNSLAKLHIKEEATFLANSNSNKIKTIESSPKYANTQVQKEESGPLQKIKELVISTKPKFSQGLSSTDLQGYMKLTSADKTKIDQFIDERLVQYVSANDPVLKLGAPATSEEKDSLMKRLVSDIEMNLSKMQDSGGKAGFLAGRALTDSEISGMIARMTEIILVDNISELREMTGEVASKSDGQIASPEEMLKPVPIELTPIQIQVYNALSRQEKELFYQLALTSGSKIFQMLEDQPGKSIEISNNGPGSSTAVDTSSISDFSSSNDLVNGQVITIRVVESNKLTNNDYSPENIKRISDESFRIGEILKLIWSEKDKTWYKIDEPPK